jgi:hypothetical protein
MTEAVPLIRERPTVDATPQRPSSQVASPLRTWLKKYWKWLIPFPLTGAVMLFVFSSLGNSEVARMAFDRAASDHAVVQRLGQPIKRGWLTSGSINTTGPGGDADLAIPIAGPKGKGELYLSAKKAVGAWTFQSLQVQVEGDSARIDLLNTKIDELLLRAQAGDAKAMTSLGYAYRSGDGMPLDYAQAMQWFQKAADAGSAGAMTALGELYFDGNGLPKNQQEAFKWFRMAAEMNDPSGLYYLSEMYEKGNGVAKDHAKAIALLKKSAQLGYEPAKRALDRLGSDH